MRAIKDIASITATAQSQQPAESALKTLIKKISSNWWRSSPKTQHDSCPTDTSKLERAQEYIRKRGLKPYPQISLMNPGQLSFLRELKRR